jgi:hypothetical protein
VRARGESTVSPADADGERGRRGEWQPTRVLNIFAALLSSSESASFVVIQSAGEIGVAEDKISASLYFSVIQIDVVCLGVISVELEWPFSSPNALKPIVSYETQRSCLRGRDCTMDPILMVSRSIPLCLLFFGINTRPMHRQ